MQGNRGKNRMGKTRDLFKKFRDTKGTFHSKTGTIKDRNGMNLTEAEDIKKRWQEYTEELYKKGLHDPENHNGVITHLESGILDCVEHNKLWKILQEIEIPDHLTCLLRNLYAGEESTVRTGHGRTFRKLRSWHLVPSLQGK